MKLKTKKSSKSKSVSSSKKVIKKTTASRKTSKKNQAKPKTETVNAKSKTKNTVKSSPKKAKVASVSRKAPQKTKSETVASSSKGKKPTPKKTIRTKKTETSKATTSKNASITKKTSKAKKVRPLQKTHLSASELKHFKSILLARKKEALKDLEILRSDFNSGKDENRSNAGHSQHMAEHGTEANEKEQMFLFIQRDQKYLLHIEKALKRIENKTYGICAISGKPIPKSRLEAVPHTTVRIEYKKR